MNKSAFQFEHIHYRSMDAATGVYARHVGDFTNEPDKTWHLPRVVSQGDGQGSREINNSGLCKKEADKVAKDSKRA